MRDEDIYPAVLGREGFTNDREDAGWQRVILGTLLAEYPGQFTKGELASELLGADPAFAELDAFERAVEDLIGVGLLRSIERLVHPTRAARRYYQLEEKH